MLAVILLASKDIEVNVFHSRDHLGKLISCPKHKGDFGNQQRCFDFVTLCKPNI